MIVKEVSAGPLSERERLINILKNAPKYTNQYTTEVNEAIMTAVNSDDLEVRNLALLTVHNGLRYFQDRIMARHGIMRSNHDYEDVVNNMFLAICENLPKWDPGKGMFTTYFDSIFKDVCLRYQYENSTYSSRYYTDKANTVEKAVKALNQEGKEEPTVLDIKTYIHSVMDKTDISLTTIQNVLSQKKDVSSYDVGKELSGTTEYSDPLGYLIEQEKKEDVDKVIEKLEPLHRLVIETERNLLETDSSGKSSRVRDSRLLSVIKHAVPTATSDWVHRIRCAAETAFKREYIGYNNHKTISINNSTPDYTFMKQMQEDIESAAMIDIGSLFAL